MNVAALRFFDRPPVFRSRLAITLFLSGAVLSGLGTASHAGDGDADDSQDLYRPLDFVEHQLSAQLRGRSQPEYGDDCCCATSF
jgi:hypothetical protein